MVVRSGVIRDWGVTVNVSLRRWRLECGVCGCTWYYYEKCHFIYVFGDLNAGELECMIVICVILRWWTPEHRDRGCILVVFFSGYGYSLCPHYWHVRMLLVMRKISEVSFFSGHILYLRLTFSLLHCYTMLVIVTVVIASFVPYMAASIILNIKEVSWCIWWSTFFYVWH